MEIELKKNVINETPEQQGPERGLIQEVEKAGREKYESLVQSVDGIVWEADPDPLKFTFVSDQAERILGYPTEQWLTEPNFWTDRQHPDDRRWTAHFCAEAVARGREHQFEYRMLAADGRVVWLKDFVTVNKQEDGSVILRGVMMDITEQKRAQHALMESEKRYRDMIENARDIIFSVDLKGNYTSANKANNEITGFSIEEVLQMNMTQIIAPGYLEKVQDMMALKLAGKGETVYNLEIIAKDGHRVAIEVNSRLIYKDDIPVGIQGIARDVTDRQELEEQLRQAQKMEAVGQLAGGIAHDFNNLLTAINGYSDLILRSMSAQDPLRPNIEEIRKAGDRAAGLTNQLLAFSRKQVLQPQVIELNLIVANMEVMLNRLIGEDIELQTALGSELGTTKADPGQIEQVIMNLAVNARDAMPGIGKLSLETSNVMVDEEFAKHHAALAPGRYVILAVTDTGEGMDENTRKHIFEPFFTTKGAGKGTGLGLSTVYGIINQSGGSITVDSEIGRGTTFRIYLPRLDEPAADSKPERNAEASFRSAETILLVENEAMVRKLGREVLESCGYVVIEAKDGVEALLLCDGQDHKIDLLLTNVVMPQIGGHELSEKLTQKYPQMRALFTSGYADDEIDRRGTVEISTNFLQKPFSLDALTQRVRETLDA